MQEYKVTIVTTVYVEAEDWNVAAEKGLAKVVHKTKDIEHADVIKIEDLNTLESY